jgi:transcriptional regulator with XRE-family HTH domain
MKQRLLLFLNYLDVGQTKFEDQVGLSRGLINKIKNGIHPNSLKKIKEKYPELNTTWLLTGEGEMLKTPIYNQGSLTSQTKISSIEDADIAYNLKDKDAKIASLQNEVLMLKLEKIEANLNEIRSNQAGMLALMNDAIIRAAYYRYGTDKKKLDNELAEINKIVGAVLK